MKTKTVIFTAYTQTSHMEINPCVDKNNLQCYPGACPLLFTVEASIAISHLLTSFNITFPGKILHSKF